MVFKTASIALATTGIAVLAAPPAQADDLSSCSSQQTFNTHAVTYTGSCPKGVISALSKNFYATKPRIYGESFNRRFTVRMRRGERVTITGTYGKSSVTGQRTREWLSNVRFALTATGRFGGTSVRCYTTGKLKGPSVDQTKWYGMTVNGKPNMSANAKAWKRCAFLVLTMEAFAYSEV